MNSLWIVTKDIRLEDNLVLKQALSSSSQVYPIFVLDVNQISSGGANSVHFLLESLQDLNEQLYNLGSSLGIVEKPRLAECIEKLDVKSAFILKGFTPFEKERAQFYSSLLNLIEIDDVLGMPREFFLKPSDSQPYKVFSPYCKHVVSKGGLPLPDMKISDEITKCKKVDESNFNFLSLKSWLPPKLPEASWIGGSTEGKSICEDRYYNYQLTLLERRNTNNVTLNSSLGPISAQFTSSRKVRRDISPHVKFGTVSPRLVYHCGTVEDSNPDHTDARGILWRALYYVLMDSDIIILKDRNIRWYNEMVPEPQWQHLFNLWCNGNTGFDFVDAGIHQLLRTGIMDNEVRMLVASFLVFVLGINWRYGENFFRINLVDYDWPLNFGNWAWCAQVGMDNPSPNKTYDNKPIRIFNPNTYKTKTAKEKAYRNSYIQRWLGRLPNSLTQICDFETNMRYWLQFY